MMENSFHIQWHITQRCNLRCRHCYQEDSPEVQDLGWGGLERISGHLLDTLLEWNQKASIHLTGGEPLLQPELIPLLDHLDRHPVVEELGIISNGLLFDQKLFDELSPFSKLKKVKISLDGAAKETNDAIRGKGVFERVLKNLPLFQQEDRFEIILMFTVMKKNVKDIPCLIDRCKHLGIDGVIIERFIPLGRGKEIQEEVLGKDEWKEMIEVLLDGFSAVEDIASLIPYQAFQISLQGEEPELFGAPCVIGADGLCIMPEGHIFPCRRFPISMGNLLQEPLKTLWERSEILRALKKKENLKGKCGRCEIKECRGCRSLALALTGDYLAEDPHCWIPESPIRS